MQFVNKLGLSIRLSQFSYSFLSYTIFSIVVTLLITSCGAKTPKEVATTDTPAVSPSGKYILMIIENQESNINFQSFQILNPDGEVIFSSPDKFSIRHTTYFLWDQDDRVWVYSGDIGTFFWENDGVTWRKNIYVENDVPAPQFLKNMRPEQHKK